MRIFVIKSGIIIMLLTFLLGCKQQSGNLECKGSYFGQPHPGITPKLFAPGIISTGMAESTIAFTPDGKECFWTLHPSGFELIVTSKMVNGIWTKPKVAEFSGKYLDGFPSIHPDGSKLFFHSFRPTGDIQKYPAKLNIWYVEKEENNRWSKPKIVESPVNGIGNSACPSVAKSGNLYFSKRLPSGIEMIVCSEFNEGIYAEPVSLPDNINTTNPNFHACISPDETYLIIPRGGRDDLIDNGWNYYVSFKNEDGLWSDLKNLGFLVNKELSLMTPSLSSDGKYFFFESKSPAIYHDSLKTSQTLFEFQEKEISYPVNHGSDIYWVESEYISLVKSLDYTNILFAMKNTIDKKGINAAIDLYWELKEKYPNFYEFSESMLNRLGYEFLNNEFIEESIKIFKLNVEVYPDSFNVYDSLGEAYMKDGQKALEIVNYEKSLKLNPQNINAFEMLKKLKNS